MNEKTWKYLPFLNVAAFIAVLAVNVLSNLLPFNGRTAGEISDALPSFFTPAGYTFSIWSLIYSALLGFIIYQALPSQREKPFVRKIGWLFILSSVLNATWLFVWHYGFYVISVLVMVGFLLTLITIYLRLNIGVPDSDLGFAERALVHFPFSLYLGWITVATIANTASVLGYLGWSGSGIPGPVWSAAMMLVAAGVAGVLLYGRRNLTYAGVLVWALFGIRAAYPDEAVISVTAVAAATLVVVFAVIGYLRTQRAGLSAEPLPQTG